MLNFNLHFPYLGKHLPLSLISVSSNLIQEPVLSVEDVDRLSCGANSRMPLSVLRKVRKLMYDQSSLTLEYSY